MDEIIIDDKKYVSSKRAAKVTGYAKDYIGQLCREGRVPARLVGRSWYVLESAIHDHRFGNQKLEEEMPKKVEPDTRMKLQSTWDSPRYEAASDDMLPSINRLRKTEFASPQPVIEPTEDVRAAVETPPVTETPEETEKDPIVETPALSVILDEGEVEIPIRSVYDLPPQDLLPNKRVETAVDEQKSAAPLTSSKIFSNLYSSVTLLLFVIAGLSVAAAVLNCGYTDKYTASFIQIRGITGVHILIK